MYLVWFIIIIIYVLLLFDFLDTFKFKNYVFNEKSKCLGNQINILAYKLQSVSGQWYSYLEKSILETSKL